MFKRSKKILGVAAVALAGVWMVAAGDHGSHAHVGHAAPDFTLTDIEGKTHTLSDFTGDGKIVVLEWYNAGCPFVVRHHDKYTTMNDLIDEFSGEGVVFLAINSTNENHRDFGIDKKMSEKWGKQAPVLLDADGKVGRMYGAKTTPHMYVIDAEGTLVYNGAIDDDRGDSKPEASKTNFVRQALSELTSGKAVSVAETKPYGCSVKYAK